MPTTACPIPLRIEAEYCRSSARTKWWNGAEDSVNACGLLLKQVLQARNELNVPGANLSQKKCATELTNLIGRKVVANNISKFLNGEDYGNFPWRAHARELLYVILTSGHPRSTGEPALAIKRIKSFFFDGCPGMDTMTPSTNDQGHAVWFFESEVKKSQHPVHPREVVAEIRRLVFRKKYDGAENSRITWASGGCQFPFRANNNMTEIGKIVEQAAKEGVAVTLVVPSKATVDSDALSSANAFLRECKDVTCIELPPEKLAPVQVRNDKKKKVWAGEFLSTTRVHCLWSYSDRNGEIQRRMMIFSSENPDRCTHAPSDLDVIAAHNWERAFVVPPITSGQRERQPSRVSNRQPNARHIGP